MDYKIWLILVTVPSLLGFIFKSKFYKSLNKIIAISIVVVGMFLNTSLIYQYFELICEAKTCSMVPTTKLSELKFPFFWRFLTFRFSK